MDRRRPRLSAHDPRFRSRAVRSAEAQRNGSSPAGCRPSTTTRGGASISDRGSRRPPIAVQGPAARRAGSARPFASRPRPSCKTRSGVAGATRFPFSRIGRRNFPACARGAAAEPRQTGALDRAPRRAVGGAPGEDCEARRRLKADRAAAGEYIVDFFPKWAEGKVVLRGASDTPKARKTIEIVQDGLHRIVFETQWKRDERGWRIRDEAGRLDRLRVGQAAAAPDPASRLRHGARARTRRRRSTTRGSARRSGGRSGAS